MLRSVQYSRRTVLCRPTVLHSYISYPHQILDSSLTPPFNPRGSFALNKSAIAYLHSSATPDLGFTLIGVTGPSAAKHALADRNTEPNNTAVTPRIRWKRDFAGKIRDTVTGRTGHSVPQHVGEGFNSDVDFTFVSYKMLKPNRGILQVLCFVICLRSL